MKEHDHDCFKKKIVYSIEDGLIVWQGETEKKVLAMNQTNGRSSGDEEKNFIT